MNILSNKMEFKDFIAGPDDKGRRLDKIIRIFLNNTPLTEIYKLLRKGLIKLNHKKAKPEARVEEGDVISIAEFILKSETNPKISETVQANTFSNPKLKIVFENEHLLIIDKPYDRTVHSKEDGIYKDVLFYLENKESCNCSNNTKLEKSLSFKPGPLHRLDRRTTGLLVFSKSIEGARWFSEGIKNHTIHKKYYGLAQGELKEKEIWQDFLSDSESTSSEGFFTVEENEDGLKAETQAIPVAIGKHNDKSFTLIEYSIKTGRKHQIRAQSALHKHPLAGDTAYGGQKQKDFKREFYLQAFSLSFPSDNPLNLPTEIKISLSSDFIQALKYCEIINPGL